MKKTYKSITAFIVLLSLVTFNLSAQLSGVVTVNSAAATGGTNYQTFGALAAALNANGISGPLTVNVLANSGPYVEQVAFNAITGTSATNTITINGNNNLLTFAATNVAPHTMLLNGTDYLYVNNLQMQGTGTTYAMVCILTNVANYNNFATCTFSCPSNGTSSYQIPFSISGSATIPTSGGMADNNTIDRCTMFSGYYAIFHYGLTSAPYTSNNTFVDCTVRDWYYYGIYSYYAKNLTFRGCSFQRPTRTTLTTQYFCYGYYMQGFLFEENEISNLYGGNNAYTGTMYGFNYAGYGSPDITNRNVWRNNVIKDTRTAGANYWFYYNYYGGCDYYHNTFSFDNPATTNSATNYVFYYCYDYQGAYNTFRNNNFSFTAGGTGTEYAYYFTTSYPMSAVNYNNYYITSTNAYIGFYTSAATNLAAWQSQGADATAYTLDPQYVNWAGGNLQPTNAALNNLGTPLNLPTDINGNPRSQTTPDIGAYEFLSNNCSTVPTASTIISPTAPLCPGDNASLLLNGFTSDLGIVYQWLTSTTSSVGPWTAISGANSVAYTTPGINATTYYGVAMTCTNSVGSTTATTILNVAGTTTNTVPYYESFESIPKANKLPNCSWSSPTLGGSTLTYTSSNTLGRSPRTGSNFATFVYLPAGDKYYYTNGIYLNAGVTYSASVWFQTEYYGYNNFADMSIMYGPAQSTTGLVTIASTNGPAVSNVYKSLSNTFTVATSGLYYVAIKANSTSGSCQYLNWDDLAITIPCSVNSPTMNLSANTTTICAGEPVVLTATGADSYVWSSGANANTTTEYPTSTGYISVVGTNSATGCTSTLSQMVVVNPSPNVLVYASTASVCAGSPANLTAFGAITYTWNTGANGANVSVSPASSTNYTVLGSNAAGCVGSAVQAISVLTLPTINASSSAPNEMCMGETQVLTATGGVTYQWVASPSGLLMSGASVNVNPMTTTIYTVTGTNAAGCSNKFTLTQNVSECVGLNQIAGSLTGVKIYPNPTAGEFTVELNNASVKTVEVMDVTGRLISSTTGSNDAVKVNLNNLSNGVYYVKIQSNNAVEVVKVVKQ